MSRDVNLNRKRKWLRVEEMMEKYVVSKTKSHRNPRNPRNSSGNRVMTRNALTPEQLLRLFEEAPFFIGAPLQPASSQKTYRHPSLLPGEQILTQEQHVTCVDTFDGLAVGTLHVTTYRVIFTGSYAPSIEQGAFDDADPEEVARRGHFYQTRARRMSAEQRRQGESKTSQENKHRGRKFLGSTRDRDSINTTRGFSRNGWFSQSMKQSSVIEDLPGLCDKQVKLKTLKPVAAPSSECQEYDLVVSIPHTSVCEIRRYAKKNLPRDRVMFIRDGVELLCSNIQSYRFCLGLRSSYDADKLLKILQQFTVFGDLSKVFAISYKNSILIPKSCDILEKKDAPNFYKFDEEFSRLDLLESTEWRTHATKEPLQYPTQTVVPSSVTESDLEEVAGFHRNGCFPAVCWRHQGSGATMLRSSASLCRRGLKESRSKTDEKFMVNLCLSNHSSTKNKLALFTEHVRHSGSGILNASAPVTQMTGQLTPEQGETFYYPNCRFVIAESTLPDFRAIRHSSQKLQSYLASKIDDAKCLSSLEDTEWLSQISELLETATQVVVAMENDKSSVVIGYEDGMDRTAQLTSLSQLMLDPYYRTLDGFQVLIQKEWLSFGHKFADRSLPLGNAEEHSPVFLQWLDCVWQLVQQFPFSFEFNEFLLETLAKHPYSSRFGTFLVNSEREMEEEDIDKKTASLWTWLNVVCMSDPDRFKNLRYCNTNQQRVLIPHYRIPSLQLWSSLYLGRHRQEHLQDEVKAAKVQALKLEQRYEDLLSKRSKLLHQLADMDSNRPSGTAFSSATISNLLQRNTPPDQLSSSSSSSLASSDTPSLTCPTPSDDDLVSRSSSAMSLTSTMPHRRMTRSKSLDDMLSTQVRQKSLRRQPRSIKRRIGGSKFYTEELLNRRNKELRNHVACRPIKEKFSSLNEYLDNTGINYHTESTVKVTSAQCCGFMVKQGQVRKSWKKRWFVLDLTKKYLAYFETDKADHPKGAISYQTISQVYEHRKGGKQKPHLFCVETPDRTYTISAPSEMSKNVWMACLTVPLYAMEIQKATS